MTVSGVHVSPEEPRFLCGNEAADAGVEQHQWVDGQSLPVLGQVV